MQDNPFRPVTRQLCVCVHKDTFGRFGRTVLSFVWAMSSKFSERARICEAVCMAVGPVWLHMCVYCLNECINGHCARCLDDGHVHNSGGVSVCVRLCVLIRRADASTLSSMSIHRPCQDSIRFDETVTENVHLHNILSFIGHWITKAPFVHSVQRGIRPLQRYGHMIHAWRREKKCACGTVSSVSHFRIAARSFADYHIGAAYR